MRTRSLLPLIACSAFSMLSGSVIATPERKDSNAESVAAIERYLKVAPSQRSRVTPIVRQYISTIRAIHTGPKPTEEQRKAILAAEQSLSEGLQAVLNPEQSARVPDLVKQLNPDGSFSKPKPFLPLISVTYADYLPTGSIARSVFGSAPSYLTLGFSDIEEESLNNFRFSFAADSLSVDHSGNHLFEISPLLQLEYRKQFGEHLSLYGRASAGPSYFDYTFNTLDGTHYGAKRFGGEGVLEVGVRYARAQISAEYRFLTEPAGINFDGLQIAATYIVVRF